MNKLLPLLAFSILLFIPLVYQSAFAGVGGTFGPVGPPGLPQSVLSTAINEYSFQNDVVFNPLGSPQEKHLLDVNIVGPTIIRERIVSNGGSHIGDWHEALLDFPNVRWDDPLNTQVLDCNTGAPLASAVINPNSDAEVIWIDIDPPIAPGECFEIVKSFSVFGALPLDSNLFPFVRILEFPTGALDFGDLPQSLLLIHYPTTLSVDGPRHIINPTGPFLGTLIDRELDGQPTVSADGDDTNGVDDEDGITFGTIAPGVASGSLVTVDVTGAGLLNAWVDFNDNDDLTDPGEQIFVDVPVAGFGNVLAFTTPGSVSSGDELSSRFRINTAGSLAPSGFATDGEVEDYSFIFTTTTDPPSPPQDQVIGGELIPIESTSLLLAGLQTSAIWLAPVVISAVGIGLVLVKRK